MIRQIRARGICNAFSGVAGSLIFHEMPPARIVKYPKDIALLPCNGEGGAGEGQVS